MRLLPFSTRDAATELSVDERLFREVEDGAGEESLRFWECPHAAVILGHRARQHEQVHEDACRMDGVPIVYRISGGGGVVIGPGCLSYSMVLSLEARPQLRDVAESYREILGAMMRALDIEGLACEGQSDLAIRGRKILGSAERLGRRALLHHGTWLYDFDLDLIARYVKEPARRPVYRGGRRHREFVANAPIDGEQFRIRLQRVFATTWA
jgi:lipoate-protein ligase A